MGKQTSQAGVGHSWVVEGVPVARVLAMISSAVVNETP